jgi:carbamoyltransferase
MYILGINCAYHESSICLLRDGEMVMALEEERLTRVKHAKQARIDNPHELPLSAVEFCFRCEGIGWKDVDFAGVSLNPANRLLNQYIDEPVQDNSWGTPGGERRFYENISSIPAELQRRGFRGRFHWLDHQLCHAAAAFYQAPFEEAAILTLDGIGEFSASIFARGQGNSQTVLGEINYPASLGFLWEKIGLFLGFTEYDACKVMGLCAYGDPERYKDRFREVVSLIDPDSYAMDARRLCFRLEDYGTLEALFGFPRRKIGEELQQRHYDLAASLQAITNAVALHLVRGLHRRVPSSNLCLAGGVALNCVTNRHLLEEGPFEHLFIPPAAHDAGTAIGAALEIWHNILGQERKKRVENPYLGPAFSEAEMRSALDGRGVGHRQVDDVEVVAARLLSEGKIVGWFQGAMEMGPRALGNRSLLADPRNPEVREILNTKVKHRENFRPFAPSVLAEEADRWFDIRKAVHASDYMLMAYPAKKERRTRIPAVVHEDGTSRIQTVKKEMNPRFHRLISEFGRLTGVPLLLNTSFNDSEPIVCTPGDAVNTFLKTGIDCLVLGNYLASKE